MTAAWIAYNYNSSQGGNRGGYGGIGKLERIATAGIGLVCLCGIVGSGIHCAVANRNYQEIVRTVESSTLKQYRNLFDNSLLREVENHQLKTYDNGMISMSTLQGMMRKVAKETAGQYTGAEKENVQNYLRGYGQDMREALPQKVINKIHKVDMNVLKTEISSRVQQSGGRAISFQDAAQMMMKAGGR